jgi:hypothetical protein
VAKKDAVMVNRAPVLTLWAAVVAERLGFESDTALSLGKVLAGLNAQAKGRALGIYGPPKARGAKEPGGVGLGEEFWIEICGRPLPAKKTEDGIRAVVKDKPVDPDSVRRYLESKFGDALGAVRSAMKELAASLKADELNEAAFPLYEQFRPEIASGTRGWGQKGVLDLDLIRSLARKR